MPWFMYATTPRAEKLRDQENFLVGSIIMNILQLKLSRYLNNFNAGGMFIYTTLLVHKKNKRLNDMVLAYLYLTKEDDK